MLQFNVRWVLVTVLLTSSVTAQSLVDRAKEGMKKGVAFFHQRVAVNGGYVYQVSADLKYREGEGDAGESAIWVQPPGTPAVGLALVEAFERTGERYLLAAAESAAESLIRGQLHSGGWQKSIEFDPALRVKQAYRVDGPRRAKAKNFSSLDDDQTQSAIRFLMKLDRALEFQNAKVHETVLFALKGVLENQYPNGGWGQGFETIDRTIDYPIMRGNFPSEWSRKHEGKDYWNYYTLNDNVMVRVIDTMWLAFEVYADNRYQRSALLGADFLLLAQMPDPQPAWAQQYNYAMQPIWARKFEPPAISGGESQDAIATLLDTYSRTGDRKYIDTVELGIHYLESSRLPDGRLARFYELKTNRPLYFTKSYELVYSNEDLPTHYGFQVGNRLDSLRKEWLEVKDLSSSQLEAKRRKQQFNRIKSAPTNEQIEKILSAMGSEGAWVEDGQLKYIKKAKHDGRMVLSATFIRNIDQLSRFVSHQSAAIP